jgi:hypothetical protein
MIRHKSVTPLLETELMSKELLENWLKLQPPSTARRMIIRTFEEVGPLYHISKDSGIRKFIPCVTRRTGSAENITIPRISVTPTLVGCFIGYGQGWSDISAPELSDRKFKNGWYIYNIPYELALLPDARELYDVKDTDEHWLVNYSSTTAVYRGDIIGKVFVTELVMVPRTGQYPKQYQRTLIEIEQSELRLFPDITLAPGYWEVYGPNFESGATLNNSDEYTIKKLSFSEYAAAKKYSADLLSLDIPHAFNW